MPNKISPTQRHLERFIERTGVPITYNELLDCLETSMAHESKQVYDCELKTIGKKLRITLVENEDRIPSIKSIFLFNHDTASNERLVMFNEPLPLETGLEE